MSDAVLLDEETSSADAITPEAITRPGLVSTIENPVPEGAVLHWIDNGGVVLRCARWPAATRDVKGTVCLIQGRSEYIEKYYEVISDFRNRGFAVLAFDFRGQGGSDRLLQQAIRGHVDTFSDYVSDLETVMSEVLLPECPAPFYAVGHSMGGAVMMHSLEKGRLVFDRIVLSAPLIAFARKRPKQSTVAKLAKILNGFGLGERGIPFARKKNFDTLDISQNIMTSDQARFQKSVRLREKGPFLKVGKPTIGWLHAACLAMEAFEDIEFGNNNRTPVLVVACGNDEVVSLAAIEKLAHSMRSLWHIVVPGARHEIMQERDIFRDQFFAAFDAFIPGTDAER
ncbi:MAG: alpha/beta fold hydrolase [Hyphomicrobiales bacterium]